LLRKVGFADRPILGGDYLPNGIRRRNSLPPRKTKGFKAFMLTEPFVYTSVSARRNPDFDEGCQLCRHPKTKTRLGLCFFVV